MIASLNEEENDRLNLELERWAEVSTHAEIVNLIGYCSSLPAIVLEKPKHGTLQSFLFEEKGEDHLNKNSDNKPMLLQVKTNKQIKQIKQIKQNKQTKFVDLKK